MMNYRRLAARAGLPAWMLLSQLVVAQDTPTEEKPTETESTEETASPEKTIPETADPGTPSLPKPKLPTPAVPEGTPGEPETDLPEVEVPLDGIPVIPGAPLPEGDPLLAGTGDGAPLLPMMGPEAPAPEIPGLMADDTPAFGQGLGENSDPNEDFFNQRTSLSGRDSDTEGLVISVGVTETYNSNLEMDQTDPLSVFYTTFTPGLSYRSAPDRGAKNIFAFNYDAGFDIYHDSAVDDATNHRLGAILTHNGTRLTAEFTGEYNQSTQASRFTEALSENETTSTALNLNYKISDKTSISADAEFSRTETSAGTASASDLFGASISGLYLYSPKVSIGPSIRIANSDSDTNGNISSYAFRADIRYRPTTKIQFQSTFGVESVDLDGEGSESSPTATLGFNYRPNPIWSFNGEVRYEAIPINSRTSGTVGPLPGEDPLERLNGPASDGDQQINATLGVTYSPGEDWRITGNFNHRTSPSFINPGESMTDTSFGIGIVRNFGKSDLSFRYTYSVTEFEGSAPAAGPPLLPRGDENFQIVSLFYNYPELFHGFDLSAGITHLDNTGSTEFDQTSVSVAASYRF